MAKRTATEAGFGGEIDLDKEFRSPKIQRLYDEAAKAGNEDVVVRDPANLMDNWLTTSRASKAQRDSRNEADQKSWKARQALEFPETFKIPGKWQYYRDKTRRWVSRLAQTHSFGIEQKTRNMSLIEGPGGIFIAQDGDKDISWIYREFWLGGARSAFIETIYNKFQVGNRIPEETVWRIFRCLVGELVPQDRVWDGAPPHIIAEPNTIWQIGKCIFLILTRGRFWDDEFNVLNPVDRDEKFGVYKQTVLQKKYSKHLMKVVLECLKVNEKSRPSQEALLDQIQLVLSIYDGTYVRRVEDDPTQPYLGHNKNIPRGLTKEEGGVYETLLAVKEQRAALGNLDTTPIQRTPHIITITDLAKDYDDLLALMILKELDRLGIVKVEGFVANLMPAHIRALFGRGALDSLGITSDHIKMGVGLKGEADPTKSNPPVMVHEFGAAEQLMPKNKPQLPDGQELIETAFKHAVQHGHKITLLLISSLMDIGTFLDNHGDLLRQGLAGAVLQGGYALKKGKLTPDDDAVNNKFDPEHTASFHKFLQDSNVKSTVFTKVATFATYIDTSLFLELEKTTHPLGVYLQETQIEQEKAFYARSCSGNPFRPFMTQEWYIQNKTGFYTAGHEPDEDYPVGDDVLPYLDRITAYDALAAVGSAGEDVLEALQIPKPIVRRPEQKNPLHHIFGVLPVKYDEAKDDLETLPEDVNIHGERMAAAICALIKGSILSVQQGL